MPDIIDELTNFLSIRIKKNIAIIHQNCVRKSAAIIKRKLSNKIRLYQILQEFYHARCIFWLIKE